MLIHIGADIVIHSEDVIAIIDQKYIQSSSINEEMLNEQSSKQRINHEDETKSIVITTDYIYHSPLSILTLKKRASMATVMSNLDDYTDEENLETT